MSTNLVNRIEEVRNETHRYFNPDNKIENSQETIFSPDGNYRIETTAFRLDQPDHNSEATKVEIYDESTLSPLFSFFVNEGTFFHSWIKKGSIDYLLCSEDLCGGQTVLDLTNKVMSSFTANEDGFIWTKHLLSPNEKLLAVMGCGWGTETFIIVYHFDQPMELPLQIAFEPKWTGYDIIEWVDNRTLKIKSTKDEIDLLTI